MQSRRREGAPAAGRGGPARRKAAGLRGEYLPRGEGFESVQRQGELAPREGVLLRTCGDHLL